MNPQDRTNLGGEPAVRKTFQPAAGMAIHAPVQTPFERRIRAEPPQRIAMEWLDIFTGAVNTINGTNRIRVDGPSMLRLEGVNVNGTSPSEVGQITFWVSPEASPMDQTGILPQFRNCFFLPEAGVYYVHGFLNIAGINGHNSASSRVFARLYRNVNPALAIAQATIAWPTYVQGKLVATGVAAVAQAIPPTISLTSTQGGAQQDAFGERFRFCAATVSNPAVGANPATFTVGDNTLNANRGIALPAGAQVRVMLGFSDIYVFSTLGATLNIIWEFI